MAARTCLSYLEKPPRNLYTEEIMHKTKMTVKERISIVAIARVWPEQNSEFSNTDCPRHPKHTIPWLFALTRFYDPGGFLRLILLTFY